MGVKSAHQLLYLVKNISIADVKKVARARRDDSNSPCRLDVDCSILAYKFLQNKSVGSNEVPGLVAHAMMALARSGFVVTPICDPPDHRHHTKQASIERIMKKERARIDAATGRCEMTRMNQQLTNDDSLSAEEREMIEKNKLPELIKQLRKHENACNSPRLPSTFIADLSDVLEHNNAHKENEHNCKVEKPLVSSFQADSLIAKRAIEKKSHMLFSRDSDFLALVGKDCVVIRDFTIRKEKKGKDDANSDLLYNFELCSCALETHNGILSAIQEGNEETTVKVKLAKYALLANDDPKLRALIVVLLGCDVLIKGIPGIGAKAIHDEMKKYKQMYTKNIPIATEKAQKKKARATKSKKKEKEVAAKTSSLKPKIKKKLVKVNAALAAPELTILEHLMQWACTRDKTGNMSVEILQTFISAFLYEPANEADSYETGKNIEYIHGEKPTVLPKYLKDFCREGENNATRIVDGPETCTCVGPIVDGRCKHLVLTKGNNVKACHGCKGNVCGMCQVHITNRNNDNDDGDNEAIFCLPCYSAEKLGIRGPEDEDDIVTIQQMREELAHGGYELDANATYIEIEDMYEVLCMKRHFAAFKDNNGHDVVPFPVLPASHVDRLIREGTESSSENSRDSETSQSSEDRASEENENRDIGNERKIPRHLLHVPFSEGGQFINDPSLSIKLVPKVLKLLATFVEYKANPDIYTKFDHPIYHALPSIFIEYANGSRHDSGLRLLRRCARHAVDPKAPDLEKTQGNYKL